MTVPVNYETIAKEACTYAREQIIEGTTQLQNNMYDLSKQRSLGVALCGIRKVFDRTEFYFQINKILVEFEQRIALCKKFSIGNCYELGLMALDYMVRNHPEVSAEVYHIEGGDHAFLVLGRTPGSDPRDPMTWGNEAFFCDPWANTVYPASQYLTHLRNYYLTYGLDGRPLNRTESFNPKWHRLEPYSQLNTQSILKDSASNNLFVLKAFNRINERYCQIYEKLVSDLTAIHLNLKHKYGVDDDKTKIFADKIKSISDAVKNMRDDFAQFSASITPNQYWANQDLGHSVFKKLNKHLGLLWNTSTLSAAEQICLDTHRAFTLINWILSFLGFKTASAHHYAKAIDHMEKGLEDYTTEVNTTVFCPH